MGWTSNQQYRSRIGSHDSFVKTRGCFIMSERTILEHYLYDVVFKCVLLTSVETSGWAIQNETFWVFFHFCPKVADFLRVTQQY